MGEFVTRALAKYETEDILARCLEDTMQDLRV